MCLILAATQLSSGDKRPENYKLTGTHSDLCYNGPVLYQLSSQANWSLSLCGLMISPYTYVSKKPLTYMNCRYYHHIYRFVAYDLLT